MSHLARSSSFRSDIEGLRAVAIILVLGAHFSFAGLSAGFIGVDIFFVISGYLITSNGASQYTLVRNVQPCLPPRPLQC